MNNNFLSINEILQQSFEDDIPKYKTTISEYGMTKLQEIEFDKKTHKNIQRCPITMDIFNQKDIVIQLPCGHIFNKDAIYNWLQNESNKCPLCRYTLPSKEIHTATHNNIHINENIFIHNNEETNTIIHPFSTLHNRNVVPHSYISKIIKNTMHNEEKVMLQEALLRSI